MADDIDDLLNAAERQLSRPHKNYHSRLKHETEASLPCKDSMKPGLPAPERRLAKEKNPTKSYSHDLSDLLDDSLDEDVRSPRSCYPTSPRVQEACGGNVSTSRRSSEPLHQPLQARASCASKCFAIYIGGCSCLQGLSTSVNCRLRCTDCDFAVSAFDNHQWHASTDYLFLRNNMPDYSRVKTKLLTRNGWRAYACQCKWRNALELAPILSDVKWVCGRH